MKRHPVDLLSAALGLLTTAIAVVVISGEANGLTDAGPGWFAVAALVLGLALIPWRRAEPDDGDQPS